MDRLFVLVRAVFDGVWLGLLDRPALHALDQRCYDLWQQYGDEAYNRRGLSDWEQEAIDAYFRDRRRLLVAAAGGGREVLALHRAGYEVDGFECHPGLAAFANGLLKAEGCPSEVLVVPRDECPQNDRMYDGLIVGWGAYMLIQGSRERISFLNKMRRKALPQSPLLVSFFCRMPGERRFRITAFVGNLFRRALGREPIEAGDALEPNYVHRFTEEEIRRELREAGYEVLFFDKRHYGHAVAASCGQASDPAV